MTDVAPHSADAELQAFLVRLWTNADDRKAFLADRDAWFSTNHVTTAAQDRLRQLDPAQLTGFADALLRKRLGQARQLLPLTAARLGPDFGHRFTAWAGTRPPVELHHHIHDARQFGLLLLARQLPPDIRDLLRWELLQLRLMQPGPACGVTFFRHDVRKSDRSPLPRRRLMALWWSAGGRSRPQLWLWP